MMAKVMVKNYNQSKEELRL